MENEKEFASEYFGKMESSMDCILLYILENGIIAKRKELGRVQTNDGGNKMNKSNGTGKNRRIEDKRCTNKIV